MNDNAISDAEIEIATDYALRLLAMMKQEKAELFKEVIQNRIRGKLLEQRTQEKP